MKSILLLSFLSLAACAHETTTMDRELALKLADKNVQIVQAAPPVININNYGGGGYQQSAPAVTTDHSQCLSGGDCGAGCTRSASYSTSGQLLGYKRVCFGSAE